MARPGSMLTAAALIAALPALALSAVLLVFAGAGADVAPTSSLCGGAGTGQQIGDIPLDAEQMANAATIVSVTARRHLPAYAAVIGLDTAYTESRLHNTTVASDHDSEGLFQQRISIYTQPVAVDPVRATGAFLDRLARVSDWQQTLAAVDAQAVQISAYPQRYQSNVPIAAQLVGRLWPAAAAAVTSSTDVRYSRDQSARHQPGRGTRGWATTSATGAPAVPPRRAPTICAGGGGAAGSIVGPVGDPVAGTTTVPSGFVVSGSAKGRRAVEFALAQLGKPYLFGAAGPDSFDCSGLTMAAWAATGVALPHLASAQSGYGTPEPTDLSQAVSGDLVMMPGSDGTADAPGHVGMVAGYVERADGRHLYLIQAPGNGIPVELTDASQWTGQVTDVRHIA